MRVLTIALFAAACAAGAAVSAVAEERAREPGCPYLDPEDCVRARSGKPDLRWNHSCPYTYPVRFEGAACSAPGGKVITGGGWGDACCAKLTVQEKQEETCRKDLNSLVSAAKESGGTFGSRRLKIRYGLLRSACGGMLQQAARDAGRSLPTRSVGEARRGNDLLTGALRRNPGDISEPHYNTRGGASSSSDDGPDAAEIISFAAGIASIVASNYAPLSVGRNPGRAPPASSYLRPAPRTRPSDITGTH